MKEKAMVLFSGGVDSTTCLGLAIEKYGKEQVIPLSIHYGQKHEREVEAARKILDYYGIAGMEMDLSQVFSYSNCSLLSHSSEEVPEASYAEQLQETGGAPVSTYVPFRNGLFLSCAASIALARGCACIYYGAHQDDAAGSAYPDCSEAFLESMDRAVFEGSGGVLRIEAPLSAETRCRLWRKDCGFRCRINIPGAVMRGRTDPAGCAEPVLTAAKPLRRME